MRVWYFNFAKKSNLVGRIYCDLNGLFIFRVGLTFLGPPWIRRRRGDKRRMRIRGNPIDCLIAISTVLLPGTCGICPAAGATYSTGQEWAWQVHSNRKYRDEYLRSWNSWSNSLNKKMAKYGNAKSCTNSDLLHDSFGNVNIVTSSLFYSFNSTYEHDLKTRGLASWFATRMKASAALMTLKTICFRPQPTSTKLSKFLRIIVMFLRTRRSRGEYAVVLSICIPDSNSASKMTYIVSGGALNFTHSLIQISTARSHRLGNR